MTERIKLTKEYLKSIGTLKGKKGLDDEETKQILDDYNTWNIVDTVLGKTATITDIINLVKENKQLRNIWKNEEDLRNKYQIENCILKQKLEKIVQALDGTVCESTIKEILEDNKK